MTAQLDTPTRTEDVVGHPGPGAAGRIVRRGAVTAVLADLALMGIIGGIIPPLALFAVATAAVFVALRSRPRALTWSLAIIAVVSNIGGVPFWSADLQHPADTVPFMWAVLSAGGRFVVIAAAFLALRRPDAGRAARLLGTTTIGLLALALVGTVTSRATLSDDAAQAGDITVEVEGIAFPDAIAVSAGDALYMDNRDPFRHTFTVEDTDVDVALAPAVARRVALDLEPGEYQVICTVPGHELMRTTLTVTS